MLINDMIGRTFIFVDKTYDEITFTEQDGSIWKFYHEQDCCESVTVEDVCGDLDNLLHTPLLDAEEVIQECENPDEYESCTWTFYKFTTIKGSVTIRWYGSSNGYYSEKVDLIYLNNGVEHE